MSDEDQLPGHLGWRTAPIGRRLCIPVVACLMSLPAFGREIHTLATASAIRTHMGFSDLAVCGLITGCPLPGSQNQTTPPKIPVTARTTDITEPSSQLRQIRVARIGGLYGP